MQNVRYKTLGGIKMSSNENNAPLISIKNLYKIFGKNEKKVLEEVKAGKSK